MPLDGIFVNGVTSLELNEIVQILPDSEPNVNGLGGKQAAAGLLLKNPPTSGKWIGKNRHEIVVYVGGQVNRVRPENGGYPIEPGSNIWMPLTYVHRVYAVAVLRGTDAEGLTSEIRWLYH